MFYYPNVLQRRTGCFSTIWLAATKGIKIPRRDYLKVNVYRTCNDILDYVLVRAPPIQPGLPRPRFSLYLSSQLQYGLIIVYHRQCTFLLEEIQHTINRLLQSERQARIDMVESDRLVLTLPDCLSALVDSERAQDPFFGVMGSGYGLPSPSRLMQQWQLVEEEQRPLASGLGTPPDDGVTASPDAITLKEAEPVVIPAAGFQGVELPEVTHTQMNIIDMLMEQPDLFPEEAQEWELLRGTEAEMTRDQPAAMVSGEQLRVTVPLSEDHVWLLDEETGLPVEVPVTVPPAEVTPVTVTLPSSPPEPRRKAPKPGVRRKKHRRQLMFIDQQTQIPQEELQEQLSDPLVETQPLVLIEAPSQMIVSPADLLNRPCNSLPPEILSLWKLGAVIWPLPDVAVEEEVDERDAESETVMAALQEGESLEERVSSKEVLRELTESGLTQVDISAPSELTLEASDRETPRAPLLDSRGSPAPESLFLLEDIVEERVSPVEGEREEWLFTGEDLIGLVWRQEGQAFFHALLPPLASRRDAARCFYTLLEMVTAQKLCVRQDRPYGPIAISAGQLYE